MNDNLIFLEDKELDENIYRIFSYERLKELFEENKLALVKPSLWDDPFENFILESRAMLPDGTKFIIRDKDNYYGQCWSKTKESDAMWRIYSPKGNGVKVKTTMRNLFQPFFTSFPICHKLNGHEYNLKTFIGKVKYKNEKYLLNMLKDKNRMSDKLYDQSGWGQASTFYFKRWAFRHENEIRIMYNDDDETNNNNNVYKFDINPNDLIDEIVFDPRLSKNEYENEKGVVERLGFKKRITQSNLYKIRQFTLYVNDL